MGFKSKVFGFLAVAALTLSMGAGIASANTNTGQGTVVIAPGSCAFEFNGSTNLDIDFGKWTWNGPAGQYDPPEDDADREGSAHIKVFGPTPQGGECWASMDISMSADGQEIGANHFRAGLSLDQVRGSDAWVLPHSQPMSWGPHPATNHWFFVRLASVPNDLVPDDFSGTITVTVSNDQPGN